MSRIIKWLCIPALALVLAFTTDTSHADAGGFSLSIGGGGYGGFGGYGGYGMSRYSSGFRGYGSPYGYGSGYRSYNRGHRAFGPIVTPRYGVGYRGYSRPHLDYHAPALVPHRGHYHCQPG